MDEAAITTMTGFCAQTSEVWHGLPAARLRLRIKWCNCGDHFDSEREAVCPEPRCSKASQIHKVSATPESLNCSLEINVPSGHYWMAANSPA